MYGFAIGEYLDFGSNGRNTVRMYKRPWPDIAGLSNGINVPLAPSIVSLSQMLACGIPSDSFACVES